MHFVTPKKNSAAGVLPQTPLCGYDIPPGA